MLKKRENLRETMTIEESDQVLENITYVSMNVNNLQSVKVEGEEKVINLIHGKDIVQCRVLLYPNF